MTRKSKREIETLLDDLEGNSVNDGVDYGDVSLDEEVVDAFKTAAEHHLSSPDEPLPDEAVSQLSPEILEQYFPGAVR